MASPAIQTRINKPFDQLTAEDDVLAAFKTFLREAEEAKLPRQRQVDKNWLFYRGFDYIFENTEGEWEVDDSPDGWRVRVHRDIVGQVVETLRPIMLRGFPRIMVEADFPEQPAAIDFGGQEIPIGVTDGQLAGALNEIFDLVLENRAEAVEVAKVLLDVLVTGTAFRMVMPNMERNGVNVELLAFEQVLPDPHGTKIDFADHKYVIIATEMDVSDIERIYHVKEHEYAAAVQPGDDGFFAKMRRRVLASKRENAAWERRRYPVYHLYYHEATPNAILMGEKPAKSLRFPRGRVVTCINEQKIVLDRHNPFWHGEFPIITYQAMPLSHHFYGRTDVDSMTSMQTAANVLYNMAILNVMQTGNNQWLYEEDALAGDYVNGRPGLMIPVASGRLDSVKRLDPMPLPAGALALVQEMEQFAREQIGGANEVLQGRAPGPNSSGVLANSLQAAAMTRQSFRLEMLDVSHRREARLELLTMQQFVNFDDPKITRRLDMGEVLLWSEAMRDLFFDVKVESKADLPHNVTARMDRAMVLLQIGAIDLEEFFDFTGLRVRESLREKIRQVSRQFVPGVPHGQQIALGLQAGQSPTGDTGSPNFGAGVPGGQQAALPGV